MGTCYERAGVLMVRGFASALPLAGLLVTLGPAADAQAPQTLRIRTDLVTLDVTVTERNGRPVTGLTAADFTIFEDGRPQEVATFKAIEMASTEWPTEWMPAVRRDVDDNAAPQGRLVAIVVDDATATGKPDVLNAVRDAARSVVERLDPTDRAAVIFTADSRTAQPFTADRDRLLRAIERYQRGWSGIKAPPAIAALTDSQYEVGAMRTLEDVVRALGTSGHFPRAVVYIGVGVRIDWDKVSDIVLAGRSAGSMAPIQIHQTHAIRLRAILQLAARLNVVVHTVDPAGLRTGSEAGDAEFLHVLSSNTGGVAVVHTNDFTLGIENIDRATRSLYLLGYTPAELRPGLRRVDVKVNRPGVVVRTRSYYERVADEYDPKGAGRRPASELAAIAGLLPAGGVPLRVTAVPWPLGTRREAVVAMVLGVSHPTGGRRALESLVVTANAFDMEGKFKGGTRGKVEVRMADVVHEIAAYEVYTRLQLPPGRYQLRLSVDHRTRGETGSVYTDVEVPDFTAPGLHVAGLIVDAGPARRQAAPATLFADVLPALPTVEREFGPGARLVVCARLVQGGRAPLEPVTVTARLTNGRGEVVRTSTDRVEAAAFARARGADYRLGLSTDGLRPDWYLVTLEAALSSGAVERRDVTMRVRP